MFYDKNKHIIYLLRQVGYDPVLIGKAADMVDDKVPDTKVESFLGGTLTGNNEPVLVLNFIKKKTKQAYLERALSYLGFLLFYAFITTLYARMSERFAWYDVLLSLFALALLAGVILNGLAWIKTKQTGPALEVKIQQRIFRVSKDTRLRIEKMLRENGYEKPGLADDVSEGFAAGDEKAAVDMLVRKYNYPLHESVQLFARIKKEFHAVYVENGAGFLVVAVITTLLSWFVWRLSQFTPGSVLAYNFILLMLVLSVINFKQALKINS